MIREGFLLSNNILLSTLAIQYQLWRLHDASKTLV